MLQPDDSQWMARALRLAERGLCTTSPNPRVGCVLVKEGNNIGEGWHERAGEPHAEVHALRVAGEAARGATAYVTLEPCSHHGRTPPCADALIAAGVTRVVVAMQDPNPLVAGRGIAKLQAADIAVECGLMETAAQELNIGFVTRMTHGKPWVRSKIAASLDGRTALANGVSKWITGEAARQDVQQWRARSCAVLTGIGTVLADDPQLNVRDADAKRQPLRVVLDTELRISVDAKILASLPSPCGRGAGGEGGVLIYTASSDVAKQDALREHGADVVAMQAVQDGLPLSTVLNDLAKRGINEVLVEAGKTLNGALLQAGLVDELVLYLAPQLLGDAARGLADLGELTQLEQRVALAWQDVRHVGNDLRITARVKR
jgi:diaminohydroxyphosphoribosylaminopyrimidine deaminase/5-amino-6-(5-phosphoribosylamino)uracil reductase